MIRILMLDLGGTLISQDNFVFPFVPEALETLQNFEVSPNHKLSLCLVSDFFMPTPARTEQVIFREYTTMLENLSLDRFFTPFEKHVTLSTNAGVNKPDRRIFRMAIDRLGLQVGFDKCLFITENVQHINAARALNIKTLQFSETDPQADFSDWSEAALLVSRLIGQEGHNNLESALRLRLSAGYDLDLLGINSISPNGKIYGQAKSWYPLPKRSGEVGSSEAPLHVGIEIEMEKKGNIKNIKKDEPDKDQIDDAAHYIKTLEKHEQVSKEGEPLSSNATHRATTDEKGKKRIKRVRFSAI